jgi:hypothetical protein
MSQLINASIDVTLLLEMANKRHSAFNVSPKNQHTYVNLQVWVNDEPDKFGDHASVQLNSAKDMGEKDQLLHPINPKDGKPGKRCYIGRGKMSDLSPKPLDNSTASGLKLDSNIYGGQPGATQGGITDMQQGANGQWQAPSTGLPF